MKYIIAFVFLTNIILSKAQESSKSFVFDGLNRTYIEYIPLAYDGSKKTPVILNLHGLGDTKENFSGNGLHLVADTANFIVLTPQAINAPNFGTAWHSGAGVGNFELNANIDDVGFLNALLDTIIENYEVDTTMIYCTGFSMGGFMTQRMACEATNRFAAIASIAGTQGNSLPTCTPTKKIPVAHFHGTADDVVEYTNSTYGIDVPDLIDFWQNFNECDTDPDSSQFPDIVTDGVTVDHFIYNNCNDTGALELFRLNNLAHNWYWQPNNDIDYAKEVWRFFYKHPIREVNTTNVNLKINDYQKTFYPNPAKDLITFREEVEHIKIYSIDGKLVFESKNNTLLQIDLSSLKAGTYTLETDNRKHILIKQ